MNISSNSVKLKKDKNKQKLFLFIFIIEIILFFFMSFFFVPQSDDMSFRYIQDYNGFGEFMHRVFYYGNGRILGNLLELFFSGHTRLFYFSESISVIILSLCVEKLTELKNSKIIVLAAIMLQNVILFRDSVSWMAGFINYYYPVIIFVFTILIVKRLEVKSDKKVRLFYFTLLLILGFCEQLFAEHNTVINLFVAAFILFLALKNKKRSIAAPLMLLISNTAGAAVEFLYRFYIDYEKTYVAKSFPQGYRSSIFSQAGLKDAVYMVFKNMKTPVLVVSASVFIFAVLFYVMFYILRKTENSSKTRLHLTACCFLYSLLAVISTYILIKYCNDFPVDNKKALALLAACLLLFVITFLDMGVLLYKIVLKHASKDYKIKIGASVFFGILSVCPFFIVFPCGYRCCVFLYFFFTLALIYIIRLAEEKYELNADIICGVSALLSCAVLLVYTFLFAKEKKIYNLQEQYYSQSIYLPNSNDYLILPELWDKIAGFKHEYIPLEQFEEIIS